MTVPHGEGTRTFGLAGLVDLESFPIRERSAPAYAEAVASARRGLRSVGCAVLESFVRPEAVEVLNDEILERKHATHYSSQIINPYFHTTVDPGLPGGPCREHVHGANQRLHPGRCLGPRLRHRHAVPCPRDRPSARRLPGDPRGCTATTIRSPVSPPTSATPGQQFTWHFDTNDFAVTVLVQPAEAGGVFRVRAGHPPPPTMSPSRPSTPCSATTVPASRSSTCAPATCRSSVAVTRCTE